jgi:hypothetical protein
MASPRRVYALFKSGTHLLFTTQKCQYREADSYLSIPAVLPSIMDPFLLWYSIKNRSELTSFSMKTTHTWFHCHDTSCLKEIEPFIAEPSDSVKTQKIDDLTLLLSGAVPTELQ